VAMGVFISYRIFRIPDMTTDGAFLTGGAVAAVLLLEGYDPLLATAIAGLAGAVAGLITGILHTRFRINAIVAGIIVTSALYSVNYFLMGKPSLSTASAQSLMTMAQDMTPSIFGTEPIFDVPAFRITKLIAALATALGCAFLLSGFFKTHFGMALRAAGDNERMITPLGVNVNAMLIFGLAMANGLVAISGGLFVQESVFATVDMGFGQLVGGLGAVIVGKELMATKSFGWGIIGAVIGSVIFQLVIALVLLLDPQDVWTKFVTSLFLLGVLFLPEFMRNVRERSVPAKGDR
jgi:putative tryptophan/tyrosine transport system permease protein